MRCVWRGSDTYRTSRTGLTKREVVILSQFFLEDAHTMKIDVHSPEGEHIMNYPSDDIKSIYSLLNLIKHVIVPTFE